MFENSQEPSSKNIWFYSTIGLVAVIAIGGIVFLAYYLGQKSATNSQSLTTSSEPQATRSIIATNSSPTVDDAKLSAEFREQAQRAADALKRLPTMPTPSKDSPTPGFEARKLDAEKAIDEAKYKARTSKDKELLKVLQAHNFFIGAANSTRVLDPDWKILSEGIRQCSIEVSLELAPDNLSAAGMEMAAKRLCQSIQVKLLTNPKESVTKR